MSRRTDLHTILKQVTTNAYFQPPESIKLTYPCIIYNRIGTDTKYANNMPYALTARYEIMLITKDPDSPLFDQLTRLLPTIRHERNYTADNLHHSVFELNY